MWRIEVEGLAPTLNKIYGGVHWSKRMGWKNEWREKFFYAIKKAQIPRFTVPIQVSVTQLSRRATRDVDAVVVGAKFFLDALVDAKCIFDDNPKYVSSLVLMSRKGTTDKIVVLITHL